MAEGKPAVLGIIGGGQLARMTAMAALRLGYRSVVLERSAECPAAATAECLVGDWNSADDLFRLAERVDVLTLENEFVDAAHLAKLEAAGHKLWPTSRSIALVQDKLIQKQTLLDAGIPVPGMRGIGGLAELESAVAELGLPLVLKARRNGYDGKGNATIRTRDDIASAWQQLRGDQGNALYVEEFCPFVSELAVVITRVKPSMLPPTIMTAPTSDTARPKPVSTTVIKAYRSFQINRQARTKTPAPIDRNASPCSLSACEITCRVSAVTTGKTKMV